MKMEIVNQEELKQEVDSAAKPLDPEVAAIAKQAGQNVQEIMSLDIAALQNKRNMLSAIEQFGMDSLQKSSRKNTLLQSTVGKLARDGEEGSMISKGLADLQREIKDLDPSALDFAKGGFLGNLFNPVRRYFDRFEKSDQVIENILLSLDKGKEILKNDNTTLEIEAETIKSVTKKLNLELELGAQMDAQIAAAVEQAQIDGEDPDKIRFVTEEILFPLRQRIMDMQQMVVVNHQGVVAMEVIRRNNKELIRGVERAKIVTVTALRTAVMVASALYNQKIVLKKINALNETTNNLITSTAQMLKEQGATIHKQSTETMLSPETLKQAFQDVLTALEDISNFKQESLPKMQEIIAQFRELATTGEREIAKLELGND